MDDEVSQLKRQGVLLATAGLLFALAVALIVRLLGICVYAAFVYQRLRRQRNEMRALRQQLAEQAFTDPPGDQVLRELAQIFGSRGHLAA